MTLRNALAILAAASLAGCASKPKGANPQVVSLPAQTVVHVVLMDKVESGISREGDSVLLVVAEDVKVDGFVAIPAGSFARARVVWSRRGDPLRMLANQPARLAISFEAVTLADGSRIELQTERFAIERSMVGPDRSREGLAQMLADTARRQSLQELARSLERGSLPDSEAARAALRRTAADLGFGELEMALGPSEADRLDEALRRLRDSRSGGLSIDAGMGTLSAVLQLASLAGTVGDRLGQMLKAPNIVAQPGTPLMARTAKAEELAAVSDPVR